MSIQLLQPVKRNKHAGSKTQYERILNDMPVPDKELAINGGPVKTTRTKWGLWLRQYDAARFNKMYTEWLKAQSLKPAE